MQTNDFSWLFYLTYVPLHLTHRIFERCEAESKISELKGRQPLDILSKHLIAPLAGILIETNHIKTTVCII